MVQRIGIIGGGISGLAAAWALHRHPDRFEIQVYEKESRIGGNAVTVDVPQHNAPPIPVDISVTACIVSAYHHYTEMLRRCGIDLVPTMFNYVVRYGEDIHAHDYDSPLKHALADDFARFSSLLKFLSRFNVLNARPSLLLASMNPFNYVSMGRMLDLWKISPEFRVKVLKPMFINFVLATSVFDMPASLFSRYLDFFDIERSTPMTTWHGGTRAFYSRVTEPFRDQIHLSREVTRIARDEQGVTVYDSVGGRERFDQVILACNANHALRLLEQPSRAEHALLGRMRYENTIHDHAVVHTDGSVLPVDEMKVSETRSTYVLHHGSASDNYEITYIMHNQQPWAHSSDRPCLVTCNAVQPIDEKKILARLRFQHVVHDVRHTAVLLNLLAFFQGRRRTWFCGAHTTINSQEHCFISGLAVARQLGADYPFPDNDEARKWFNFHGRIAHGVLFRRARRAA
ncbi:FAD-dependent oxidoreductase [Streptomyces sp. NPDC020681]|uniref:FAD-dependent oxidoreductase n=1 Tax=Streptomyces sp. NPDC020681 TaxID=3365083 RepID=UPI003799FABC